MSGKWSSEQTLHFIRLYRRHDCLWDVRSHRYKNKQLRAAALADIRARMDRDGFGGAEIKTKIRILRSTYCQEKKKVLASGGRYRPALCWYQEMDAIMAGSHRPRAEPPRPAPDAGSDEFDIPSDEPDDAATSPARAPDSDEEPPLPPLPPPPRARRAPAAPAAAPAAAGTEYDIFGASVAAQLKRLSPGQACVAQEQIQSVLTRSRLRDLSGPPPPAPPAAVYLSPRPRSTTPCDCAVRWSPTSSRLTAY